MWLNVGWLTSGGALAGGSWLKRARRCAISSCSASSFSLSSATAPRGSRKPSASATAIAIREQRPEIGPEPHMEFGSRPAPPRAALGLLRIVIRRAIDIGIGDDVVTELDLRQRLAVRSLHRVRHIAHERLLQRIVKTISLLKDRAVFGDLAEPRRADDLRGNPVPLALFVQQIKLRVVVPLDPHAARRNARQAAQADEQGAHLFTIAAVILNGIQRA